VTKRRPWWSDFRRRAAALAAGLLLFQAPASAADGERAKRKKATKPPAEVVGGAELLDAGATGLHGVASFYGPGFHGRRTATGEVFDQRGYTAASNRFPLNTWVAVRRMDDGRCVVVKINDRMHASHRRRVVDLSRAAAEALGMIRAGVVLVRVAGLNGPRDPSACGSGLPVGTDDAFPEEAPWSRPSVPPQLDAMH
jgi:rare lipoprotein A